ncbi:TRAP transporter small permease [Amylibacter sp. SFDW26]|uniref:TRAP transporter small permease n=1 Tax=Amylibacter sp. SFDW26 TaxID=2652722 RepID=UPI0012629338|nr:TRAP transporter small permease [Amylibacter sp. SFDW26]KAB7615625.1 TRAP transporter small permease [Amylibacter sp. SFDW26]
MTKPSNWIERLEENLIAFLLGAMTLLTFANVAARYAFNTNIFYALELTVFMFAWLVLLGASYAVKKSAHLGVDAIINLAGKPMRRKMALFVSAVCILYAALLLKGSWDYWAPYANLQPTSGRWFPTGFTENVRGQGWYETQDVPVPFFMTWLETVFNDGDPYEKMPKVVPYLVMPLSMALLLYRFCQAGIAVWKGQSDMLIVSHEAEEDVEEAAKLIKEQEKDL